jgi:hypothetical protein
MIPRRVVRRGTGDMTIRVYVGEMTMQAGEELMIMPAGDGEKMTTQVCDEETMLPYRIQDPNKI